MPASAPIRDRPVVTAPPAMLSSYPPPAAPCLTIPRASPTPHCWRSTRNRRWRSPAATLDRRRWQALREQAQRFWRAILARKDAPFLPPRLRRRRCGFGRNLVVRGERICALRPQPAVASTAARPARTDYLHHPLGTHEEGRRLAKRDLAPTLKAMREAGGDRRSLAAQLLEGQLPLGFRLSQA